jgi:hypothetical protein
MARATALCRPLNQKGPLIKSFFIAAFSIVMMTAAFAQVADELPYKEDGPERDYFLQTSAS